ncbi:MAG: hypothetical protein WCD76_14845 [Pyrinomonadaceae bacterium]
MADTLGDDLLSFDVEPVAPRLVLPPISSRILDYLDDQVEDTRGAALDELGFIPPFLTRAYVLDLGLQFEMRDTARALAKLMRNSRAPLLIGLN